MRAPLVAAVLLLPGLAAAQPAPLPTRDVSVQYGIQDGSGGEPQVVHMSFDSGSQRMRLQSPGDAGYTVVDHGAGQTVTAVDAGAGATQAPMPDAPPGRLPTDGAVAQGQGSLNGVPCTVWSFAASGNSVCVGDDGVPLYGDGTDADGRPRRFSAMRVDYGTPSVAPPVVPPDRPVERRAVAPAPVRNEFLPGLGFHYGGYHGGGGRR